MKTQCPACGGAEIHPFYRVNAIPVHSVINFYSRADAIGFPRGDLELVFCNGCGFIFNRLFDDNKMHYCTQYEETQGFSETFRRWHKQLAQTLINRYSLRNKSIIEIGCGKGEFLSMLCEMGDNHGIGFDPSYVPARNHSKAVDRIQFIQDLYSERYSSCRADFVCCKMTLEHIHEPFEFLRTVRRSIGNQYGTVVFFQVPDIRRILTEVAFWDIYYEHCSYFSLGSLARIFRRAGFRVLNLATDYAGQYIMVDALPADTSTTDWLDAEEDLPALRREVDMFEMQAVERIAEWGHEFAVIQRDARRAVLWGSGSKAVSFLGTIRAGSAVKYAVDINPHRQGTYIAGNGQRVIPPAFLCKYHPDLVLAMNDIYLGEISQELIKLGLKPELRAVCGKSLTVA